MKRTAGLLLIAGCAPTTDSTAPTPPANPPRVPELAVSPAAAEIRIVSGRLVQGGFARGRLSPATANLTLDGKPVSVAADGGFFIAFDRDAAASATLRATGAGALGFSLPLAIADRDFPEERLPPIHEKFESDPAFEARRADELARIRAARAGASKEQGWQERFIWPSRGRISGVFGSQRFFGNDARSPHSGTDIAPGKGAPVVAPAAGRVVLAPPPEMSLEGNLVIVDHGLGLYSAFLHLDRAAVKVGDLVKQGDSIGTVGASGRTTGPHLHWGVTWNGVRFDPATLAGPMPDSSLAQ